MRHILFIVEEEDGSIARGNISNLEIGRVVHYGINRAEACQYLRNRCSCRPVESISVGEAAAR